MGVPKTWRVPLHVVFYKEDGDWVAHCLEFDLMGDGATQKEALGRLKEAIDIQVKASIDHKNPQNLFSPADSKYFMRYAAGVDVVGGFLRDRHQRDYALCTNYLRSRCARIRRVRVRPRISVRVRLWPIARSRWRNQRGQDSLMVFSSGNSGERTGGRPRFRRVEAKPSRAAVCCIHSSDPCGLPL